MLSRLNSILTGLTGASYPSVVLILEAVPFQTHILHVVPENGVLQSAYRTQPSGSTPRYGASKELSREQLGTVLVRVGDGEDPQKFLRDIGTQAAQSLSSKERGADSNDGAASVEEALRLAAVNSLRERETQEPPVKTAQTYSIFLARISRSKPGRIITGFEPRSISR